ncbi:MAG: hypothetical protein JXD23_05165 [Spirochaetales bacterium]|nr:hypothetical protein [Spirochaetales bacterium]
MSSRRALSIVFVSLVITLSPSCRPDADAEKGVFYGLSLTGEFVRTESPAGMMPIALQPWTRQVRVADLYSRGDRLFLTVNRHGLAELAINGDSIAIQRRYDERYFGLRTATRIFPYGDDLFCHVYFDSAFAGDNRETAPAERVGLLRYSPSDPGLGFRPVVFNFPARDEPWEAVSARPLDAARLALEWKKTSADNVEFAYSMFDQASGTETEETRAWYYDAAEPDLFAEKERDPVLRTLVTSIAGELARETAGSVVLCESIDAAAGREARFLFPAAEETGNGETSYEKVTLRASSAGWLALLPDCRFIIASSPDAASWFRGLLPALPAGFRYTGLAEMGSWLCFSWEEVDFYLVGRSGIFLRRR